MAKQDMPSSVFGEDTSFEKTHTRKGKVTSGDLKKMETEGTAHIATKTTTKRHRHHDSEPRQYLGKHKGQLASLLFVITILMVGVTATVLLSPSLLLVNIKENLVNDLNDGTKAYYVYSNKVLDMTASGSGCDYQANPSIKCKFTTMSTYMRKNFSQHGFKIMPPVPPDPYTSSPYLQAVAPPPAQTRTSPPERKSTRVVSDTYGNVITGQLSTKAKNDSQFRQLLYKVFSPRTSLFQDRKFDERLYYKFHIVRDTAVGGMTADAVKQSFDSEVAGDGTDYIDLNGHGNYGVAKLARSASQWSKIMTNLIKDKNGLKVTSFATLACAYDAYQKIAANAVVTAQRVSVARYAMNYLEAADAIKAGYAQPVTSMVLSGMLVNDGHNATDASSYRTPAMYEPVQGAITVADPSRYLAMLTAPGTVMGTLKDQLLEQFAHGVGLSSPAVPPGDGIYQPKTNDPYGWCTAAQSPTEKYNNEVKFVPTAPPTWYCNVHPQSLASILGPAFTAAETAAESTYYISPSQAVACMVIEEIPIRAVALALFPPLLLGTEATFSPLRAALQSQAVPYLQTNPTSQDIQDTIFAGTGIILGDMAQSRGLKPVTQNDIPAFTQYLKEAAHIKQQTVQDKIAVARSEPFNIYNRYSFLGMIVQDMFGGHYQAATTPLDGVARVLGMMGSSLQSAISVINPSSSALFSQPLAPQFDTSRLNYCSFNNNQRYWGKEGINIKADFGCNIRYYMPQSVLNKDINSVLDYMTRDPQPTDVDWAQQAIDQLNQRQASGRDAARLAKLKQQARQGASTSFIDKTTGKPNPHTQYAKFLQYCVNRQDPWGASALAVAWEPREFQPNAKYYYGKDIYAMYQDPNNPGKAPDTPDSYYALGAGPPIDQDWYTGKNCLKDNEMIDNFRAYTLACSVLAAMSGSRECWDVDEEPHEMPNDFYVTNDILFLSNQSASGFGGQPLTSKAPPPAP